MGLVSFVIQAFGLPTMQLVAAHLSHISNVHVHSKAANCSALTADSEVCEERMERVTFHVFTPYNPCTFMRAGTH